MNHRSFEELVARFEDPGRAAWQKPDVVLQKLGPLAGKVVADIGAGSGYFTVRLAALGAQVVAVDIDQRFLDYVSQRAPKEKNGKLISVRLGAPDDPQLTKSSLDSVLVVDVYHHLENRGAYLKHLSRALRPAGKILVVDFKPGEFPGGPPDSLKVPSSTVIQELTSAGFVGVSADVTTLPYQYLVQGRVP